MGEDLSAYDLLSPGQQRILDLRAQITFSNCKPAELSYLPDTKLDWLPFNEAESLRERYFLKPRNKKGVKRKPDG
ncbi:hypothetical protein GCM10027342_54570 [Photobacterium alginatilyticum]